MVMSILLVWVWLLFFHETSFDATVAERTCTQRVEVSEYREFERTAWLRSEVPPDASNVYTTTSFWGFHRGLLGWHLEYRDLFHYKMQRWATTSEYEAVCGSATVPSQVMSEREIPKLGDLSYTVGEPTYRLHLRLENERDVLKVTVSSEMFNMFQVGEQVACRKTGLGVTSVASAAPARVTACSSDAPPSGA